MSRRAEKEKNEENERIRRKGGKKERSNCRGTKGRSLEGWASERAKERLKEGEKANGIRNKDR